MNTINRLNLLVNEIPSKIEACTEQVLSHKHAPEKWSKKEILGHLCDSAVNNLSRFIRAQFEPQPFKIVSYAQNEWVKLNHWQYKPIKEVLNFWVILNKQIIEVISKMPEDKLAVVCDLGDGAFRQEGNEKNILWLIEDYVIHMEYHLRQIINEDWLRNEYK